MRDLPDFHIVRPEHGTIHVRLLNWARVVKVHVASSDCGPMFKHYRTSAYSFDKDEAAWIDDEPKKPPPDMRDGWRMEKLMRGLPEKHRLAVKWAYIEPFKTPAKVSHRLGVTQPVLVQFVHEGRAMLKNRA